MGFTIFNLSPALVQAIAELGFGEPTPVQASVIPLALKKNDIRACAKTGTGKTCAFVIPILESLHLNPSPKKPYALILTPTRELATQVNEVVLSLSRRTKIKSTLVLGGHNINRQIHQLKAGSDIIVATPGRLIDLIQRGAVNMKNTEIAVLDEADRMMDMGFLPTIRKIIAMLSPARQTMLFSATYSSEMKNIAQQFLKNPSVVDLSPNSVSPSDNVTQMAYPVSTDQKRALLQSLLEITNMTSVLIFTRTKRGANKLVSSIRDWGKKATVIHSNRSQSQRRQALEGFKSGYYKMLVATDIAARGIDVKDISHVINFDVPRNPEDYVHRIGRTGRAEAFGESFTLVVPEEEEFLSRIEKFIKKPIPRGVIPDFPYQKPPHLLPPAHKPKPSHSNNSHHNRFGKNRHPSKNKSSHWSRFNHTRQKSKSH